MKINIQKITRGLLPFVTILLIVSISIPAFAAPIEEDIYDYATIEVDGFTKVVTVTLPTDWLEVGILDSGYYTLYEQSGNVSGFDLTSVDFNNGYLFVAFAPLGDARNPFLQTSYNARFLNLSQLPNGSVLHYTVSAEMQATSGQLLRFVESSFCYSTIAVGEILQPGSRVVPTTVSGSSYSSSYDYTITDNSKPFVFQHLVKIYTDAPSSRWIFRLDNLTITTTIDALAELQKATGETNRLLQEIIDGDPAYKDVIDEAMKDVQDDSDKIQDSIDQIEQLPKPEIDLDELVPDELAGQAYLNYIAAVRPIWESDLLMSMATIGVCVMVFSYLLFGKKG